MSDWPRGMEIRSIDAWPGEETAERRGSNFSAGLTATLELLDRELRALGVRATPILEVAIPAGDFRNDGRPRAAARARGRRTPA